MIRKEKLSPRGFKPWLISLTLLCADLISITAAFLLAYGFRSALMPIFSGVLHPDLVIPGYLVFVPVLIIQFWLNGLYPGLGRTGLYEFQILFRAIVTSVVFSGVLIYFLDFVADVSRLVFLLASIFTGAILPGLRLMTHRVGSRALWWGKPVLIYASSVDAVTLVDYLRESHRVGLVPHGVIQTTPDRTIQTIADLPVYAEEPEELATLREKGYDHVIAVEDSTAGQKFPIGTLEKLSQFFPTVDLVLSDPVLNIFSMKLGELNGALSLRNGYNLLKPGIVIYKRIFDLLFSVGSILITLPIFLVISVAILIDDGLPILFFQQRIGRGQKLFTMIKFRTMTRGAHLKLGELLESDDAARAEYETLHKLTNDPRLTRVGRLIRRYGLDELPQVINVFRGEMSWIGPRAYMPEELERIGPSAGLIFRANPGLTGWWQVNGRNRRTFDERLMLDKYYISNFSPLMDLFIIYKTIFVLFEDSGM